MRRQRLSCLDRRHEHLPRLVEIVAGIGHDIACGYHLEFLAETPSGLSARATRSMRATATTTKSRSERGSAETAERADWQIEHVYKDHGISGAKGKDKRPQFDALHKAAVRREFDVVMAWSVDRLGRSLQDLVSFLSEIHAAGVDLFLHQQGIDTTTPGGKAMFQMLGVFAEFERAIMQERVRAGLQAGQGRG